MIRVIQSIADLENRSGGPTRSVSNLALSISDHGLDVSIGTGTKANVCYVSGLEDTVEIGKFDHLVKFKSPAIIHDHGLWLVENHYVAKRSRKLRIKRIVSPRGMLEPWPLNHKKWKKKLAWWIYQKRDLQTADCLHATAESEAEQFRKLGLRNPIAIIPNGVEMPENCVRRAVNRGQKVAEQIGGSVGSFQGSCGERKRTFLFLSRIQKKKGLLNLVAAWTKVKQPGWRILVVGPEEDGHLQEVKAAAKQAGVLKDFIFEDAVSDGEKWAVYNEADVFVLPTFSENFGIVVAEALASSIPVITTKGAPWKELETHQCGWWVDVGVDSLAQAMESAMNISGATRAAMGSNGRKLVQERYTWPCVAKQMLEVYRWVLFGGKTPATVTTC